MNRKPTLLLLLVLLSFAGYAQQTYTLDIKKSKILWDTRKSMGGHHGYLLFKSGNLEYSLNGEPVSGFFTMDMNTMRSTDDAPAEKNKEVTAELKTPGFFDMGKYPFATMNVKQITRTGNANKYSVIGELTIKGITHPITFTTTITKKEKVLQAAAELTIDRVKWRIDLQPQPKSWNPFAAIKNELMADEIAVALDLVFLP